MNENVLPALTAILVFLVTVAALWMEQEWWYVVPFLGFVVVVPVVYLLMQTGTTSE